MDWNSYGSSRGVTIAIEIKRLKAKPFLDSKERAELVRLEADLERVQAECWHTFENITLYLHVRRFCSKCDKEDKSSQA